MALHTRRPTGQRLTVANRETSSPQLQVHTTTAALDANRAVSRTTQDVLSRLNGLTTAVVHDRTARQFKADAAEGQRVRTAESLAGTEAAQADGLTGYSDAFRRGYFLTEAANKVSDARRTLHRQLAAMEPGDDPRPVVEAEVQSLLTGREFRDPQVMEQIAPALNRLRDDVLTAHQKHEMAEVLTRQTENLTTLARLGIQDGSLLSAAGLEQFYSTVETEQFAYLSRDDANDLLSSAVVDLLETGEIEPQVARGWLQSAQAGNPAPLWDRRDSGGTAWSDRFDAALSAGQRVRDETQAAAVAQDMADRELTLQRRAYAGLLSDAEVFQAADHWNLSGTERLAFVRHWGSKAEAGRRRNEERVEKVRKNSQVLADLSRGNAAAWSTADIQGAIGERWQQHVQANGFSADAAVQFAAYAAQHGAVVPQIRDMLNRPCAADIGRNADLYRQLVAVESIVADDYLTDETAYLYHHHTQEVTRHGATAQEALTRLPTGANKATRREAETQAGRILARASRERDDIAGLPAPVRNRAETMLRQIVQQFPDADEAAALDTAVRRARSRFVKVAGRHIPRGVLRPDHVAVAEEFVDLATEQGIRAGMIDPALRGRLSLTTAGDGDTLVLSTTEGFPIVGDDRDGRPTYAVFDPLEAIPAHRDFTLSNAEREAREGNARRNPRHRPTPTEGGPGINRPPATTSASSLLSGELMNVVNGGASTTSPPAPRAANWLEFLQQHKRNATPAR